MMSSIEIWPVICSSTGFSSGMTIDIWPSPSCERNASKRPSSSDSGGAAFTGSAGAAGADTGGAGSAGAAGADTGGAGSATASGTVRTSSSARGLLTAYPASGLTTTPLCAGVASGRRLSVLRSPFLPFLFPSRLSRRISRSRRFSRRSSLTADVSSPGIAACTFFASSSCRFMVLNRFETSGVFTSILPKPASCGITGL